MTTEENKHIISTELICQGERSTIIEIISLLNLIRNAIQSNNEININISVGKIIKNGTFSFSVDGELPKSDFNVKDISININ